MTSLDPGPPPADVAVRRERFGSLAYDYTDRRLTFRRPKAQAADVRLTDELKGGLDAPICLTWELTYGCNLACIHCLSSSGRRDPRADDRGSVHRHRRAARSPGLLRQHRRRRADHPARLLRADRIRGVAAGRREVLDQRVDHHAATSVAPRRPRLRRRADLHRRGRRRDQRRGPRHRELRGGPAGDGPPGGGRVRPVQDQHRAHPAQREPARPVRGPGCRVRGAAPGHPAPAVGAGGGHVGSCTRPRRSRSTCTTGSSIGRGS